MAAARRAAETMPARVSAWRLVRLPEQGQPAGECVGADDFARKSIAASGGAKTEGVLGVGGGTSLDGLEGTGARPRARARASRPTPTVVLPTAVSVPMRKCRGERRWLRLPVAAWKEGQGVWARTRRWLRRWLRGWRRRGVDLVGRDGEWGHENHHGAEGAQDDPVASDDSTDTRADGFLWE